MNAAATWRSAALSDTGRQRAKNEDRVLADDGAGLFLVVDGLGGHPAGDRAAEIAVDVITREMEPARGSVDQQVREAITAKPWRLILREISLRLAHFQVPSLLETRL